MKYRLLGKTGLNVSEIGMGTWQQAGLPWGWDPPDEQESLKTLRRFLELGGNFVDTAYVYGRSEKNAELNRHSAEELIGQFLKETGSRDKIILATKIPPKNGKWPAWKNTPITEVFPDAYIEKIVDESLKNFKIDTIDLMQFHVWQDDFVNDDGWKKTIQKITKAGKVRFWGISINDYQPSNCLKTLDTGLISTIQCIFNLFHQKPTEKLFPYVKKHNIGLIARVPLDEGGLTGRLTLESTFTDPLHSVYFSKDRLKEVVPRVDKIKTLLGSETRSLPELVLRYILSWDAVSATIPGTRKVKYVEANTSVSDGRRLSPKLMTTLKTFAWERNFYVDRDLAMKDSHYVEV